MSTERRGPAEIDRPACFASLVEAVAGCRRCQGMAYAHVLGDTNGPLDASLIVVGEAPGRLGAARTGVPFRGDRSGDRLEALFDAAAIDRADVFVTNAVLCNPLSGSGVAARNRRPRSSELARCLPFLERTLALVDAPVVAALGGVALAALGRIEPHGVAHVTAEAGRPRPWAGRARWCLWCTRARARRVAGAGSGSSRTGAPLGRWSRDRATR